MSQPQIVCDPKVLMGKPVLAGTRLSVEFILEKFAAGETSEHLLAAHPRLTTEGIQATLEFAPASSRKA
jgi:uncharacterized protein (DUF433 family)